MSDIYQYFAEILSIQFEYPYMDIIEKTNRKIWKNIIVNILNMTYNIQKRMRRCEIGMSAEQKGTCKI